MWVFTLCGEGEGKGEGEGEGVGERREGTLARYKKPVSCIKLASFVCYPITSTVN